MTGHSSTFSRMGNPEWMRSHTAAERANFQPPPCPQCGSTNITANWKDSTTDGGPKTWLPTTLTCQACHGTGTRL